MMLRESRARRVEFGDFQTPHGLAREVCGLIRRSGFEPASVLEPTCGHGSFLQAAVAGFPGATRFLGADRDLDYVQAARAALYPGAPGSRVEVRQADFFQLDWAGIIAGLTDPILILGNPPWVTNAALGSLGSANLPHKSNVDKLRGIEALTGRSNFDISEWMLRQSIQWISGRNGMLAVLCKTAVARKVLAFAWSAGIPVEFASIHRVDANAYFGASVEACLLMVRTRPGSTSKECGDYSSLSAPRPSSVFGLRDGRLVANVKLHDRWSHLAAPGLNGWRSGIKHDCSTVFELDPREGAFANGLGEQVQIEQEVVFPLLKSSDLARHRRPRKWMLVPQRSMSDSPDGLQRTAPKAWRYLTEHSGLLDKRASSIYQNRPRFSIFGVGPYSFSQWKIAISGLYKKLDFVAVPSIEGKPVVLDDTCYFFPCDSEEECDVLRRLVTSEVAAEFWSAFIFWDEKRPITAKLLNALDLSALAEVTGQTGAIARILAERQVVEYTGQSHQRLLFRESSSVYR